MPGTGDRGTEMDKFEAGPFENGAAVIARRDERGRMKFDIFDAAAGDPVRMMYDRGAAIAFAKALPVPEGLEPIIPPSPLNISPRAHALRKQLDLDVYVPVPEPNDGGPDRSMSAARARSGAGPSERRPYVQPRPRIPT
jgi:hypothetical protein